MKRQRSKSPLRLTRDAEKLISLSTGLAASGSRAEDRYWEAAIATLADLWGARRVVVDATGLGAGLASLLHPTVVQPFPIVFQVVPLGLHRRPPRPA